METVERGVSNFVSFQREAREFFNRYDERERQKEEDWKRRRDEEKASNQKIDSVMTRLYRTLIIVGLIYGALQVISGWVGPEIRHALGIAQVPVHSTSQDSSAPRIPSQ